MDAIKELKSSRCQPWDDKELDTLDGLKFIGFILLQLTSASLFMAGAPQYNTWKLFDFLTELFFTLIVSANQATDLFITISAFLGTYKLIQASQANPDGKLHFSDFLVLFLKKYLRLAPLLYVVFFMGWVFGPRLQEAPAWVNYNNLYY